MPPGRSSIAAAGGSGGTARGTQPIGGSGGARRGRFLLGTRGSCAAGGSSAAGVPPCGPSRASEHEPQSESQLDLTGVDSWASACPSHVTRACTPPPLTGAMARRRVRKYDSKGASSARSPWVSPISRSSSRWRRMRSSRSSLRSFQIVAQIVGGARRALGKRQDALLRDA